jgi:membrane associated rhomboid family serine protease
MERYAYCNLLVIAISCWVSFLGFRSRSFEEKYLFWPEAILAWHQRYRIVTSGFLHLNEYHLAMNMVSLYFFGPLIERIFGPVQFLAIYLAAVVGGNLLSLYVHRYHDYRALGASGGVSGVILAYTLLFPGGRINPYFFVPIAIPAWLFAILYLLASFYGMHRQMTNVGHDAHLGGALVGLFTAAAFHPSYIRYNPWWFAGISAGTGLLLIYMARNATFIPLEGFDFTKPKAPRASEAKRFSFRGLFNFTRRASLTGPKAFVRPDRQIDAILQKISEQGLHSLTKEEQELMKKTSEKYRRRSERNNPESGFPF